MKIKNVRANNHKKCFEIETVDDLLEFPYPRCLLRPSEKDPVSRVYVDPEIAHEGFTYTLKSGREDTVLLDQVLEYHRDSEYLRKGLLYRMTVEAKRRFERHNLSKRAVIRRMGTTPTQFYRLMDTSNYRKTIDQMVRLLAALDCAVEIAFEDAA